MKCYTNASSSADVTQRELDNLQIAYQAACESIVLLKNEGVLPLSARRVALYGSGVTRTIKGGTGSGEVNERHSVTILEGMEDRGFEVASRKWLDDFESGMDAAREAYREEKRKRLNIFKPRSVMDMLFENFRPPVGRPITQEDVQESATDSCIYVVSRQAGEGGDRKMEKGDYLLTDEELSHIRFCAANYAKFILVINGGSAVDLGFTREIDGIGAILFICQLGTEGGHAFADVISGVVTPSGKLTDTWAQKYEDIPFSADYSYLNGNLQDEDYKEGIFVGYRYFDTFRKEPAYPFGFGLSYTDFAIRTEDISLQGSNVEVSTRIINTGTTYSGAEVAQLYVSAPAGQLQKEYQSLAAFAKTPVLAPGESCTLPLHFDLKRISSFRENDNSFVLEQGDYVLRLGNSSRNTARIAVVRISQEQIVSRHEAVCPLQKPLEELTAPMVREKGTEKDIPVLTLAEDAIVPVVYSYESISRSSDPKVREFVDGLSLGQMLQIVVGIGMFGGRKTFHLPGSVGNTTSKLWKKGLVNVALCDGPAGLRVQQTSVINKRGKVKATPLSMTTFTCLPGFVKRLMLGNPKKGNLLYQYTTAFPVTNALAQSWNVDLMEKVGKAVLREMQEYGCTYWLAPAVNIHRNPLCGRNFEYYSEDPLLTGHMAAAITRGVQSVPGYYVTVKHFACNNQEDNRTHVSSNVSQRALREIYLRGFEDVVRLGGAKSVMTSYNRLNGVYTPNSYDLCTKVLRNEWDFDGVVMTDWFSTNFGQGSNSGCMTAGNDLIMPGGGLFRLAIRMGVLFGKVKKSQIRICCENVVKSIMDSSIQQEYME